MIEFAKIPVEDRIYLLEAFSLPEDESRILFLKYVFGFSYQRIAGEMNISEKSVGALLSRARKDIVTIAKECYDISDDKTKSIIRTCGWDVLEWPTLKNRKTPNVE